MFRKKKIPFGRIIPPFFFESSESDRFFNHSGPENRPHSKQHKVDVRINVDLAMFFLSLQSSCMVLPFMFKVVAFLVLGFTVSAFYSSSLDFWRLYTGLLVLKIWATLGVLSWRCSFSFCNGLDWIAQREGHPPSCTSAPPNCYSFCSCFSRNYNSEKVPLHL